MPTARRPEPKERKLACRQHRPRRFDADGLDLPTALEIEEGTVYKAHKEKPSDAKLYTAARMLYFRLINEEGIPATSRCPFCGVVRYGRTRRQPCGHCGRVEVPA